MNAKISLFQLIESGGLPSDIILIILAILSLITIYILVERTVTLHNISKLNKLPSLDELSSLTNSDKIDDAINLCQNADHPLARILEQAILKHKKPIEEINLAVQNKGKYELALIEKNLSGLGTISGVAPMIGFLGTVIGMILAFHSMSTSGENIEIKVLSEGIYTAMVTTVAGLIVGIVSYVSYNFLSSKVNNIIQIIEKETNEFIEKIKQ
tara:strand:- start:2553 stop:3188 length:636 start_codon:yes stop_codon:yes gene_type:complete